MILDTLKDDQSEVIKLRNGDLILRFMPLFVVSEKSTCWINGMVLLFRFSKIITAVDGSFGAFIDILGVRKQGNVNAFIAWS